jgi:integrase/recombinase XerD
MATMSPLRRRMIEDMTVRNLSPATQQSYLYAVAKFSRHFGAPPAQLGTEQVRAYQLHLIAQKRSWSHINQVACALRFFYGVTLGQKEAVARIVSGREPEKLPPVLNPEEIVRFLDAVAGLRNRVALTTAYAAGLRVGEVARLKVPAIDSTRMLIHVEHGKGGRDRYAMLSPRLLGVLRAYWRRARPGLWLFPGQEPGCQHRGLAGRLPGCQATGEDQQARHGPHAPAQFCHSSSGERDRHPDYPGPARARRAGVDGPLCAGRHNPDRRHAEPLRPPFPRGGPARVTGPCVPRWRWRISSAATARPSGLRKAID